MSARSDLKRLIREFVAQGFVLQNGGKHPILYRKDVGRISLPSTPGDVRSIHNARAHILRRIRMAGDRP